MDLSSVLQAQHLALGARFAVFGGWSMPVEYAAGGVLAEHQAVRQKAGLFDVSHLGKLRLQGPGAVDYLNSRLTNDLGRIGPGRAQYSLLCNDSGGVVDDLIVYLLSDDEVLLVPNAANTATVASQIKLGLPDDIKLINQHRDFVVLAVQGPQSPAVMTSVGLPTEMDYMSFQLASLAGTTVTVCRTGYTGETGFEIIAPNQVAEVLWTKIIASGVRPCGLGARDTLRTEMGYPLHGQDISPEISPVEAGLTWAVGWQKTTFDGASALVAAKDVGPGRRLRGLKAKGRGIPRPGMLVVDTGETGLVLGQVTSGTFSPTLKTGIALALVEPGIGFGQTVGVAIRGRVEEFEVVKPPFVVSGVH